MSKLHVSLALSLIVAVNATGVRAEAVSGGRAAESSMDVLLDAVRSNRKAIAAVNLGLTDAEAARFWPVYDRYQKEIRVVGDRWIAVIEDYIASFPGLTDEEAAKLVEDYLTVEADRLQVRRSYVPEFSAVLPGRKLARFYQIENKMDAVIRYDLAARIPVVEQEASAPAR
jgi:hypothetical protein